MAGDAATQALEVLILELGRLPGIGRKTAERLAHHLLRLPREEAMKLAAAIRDVKQNIRHCRLCFNITEGDECAICRDPGRDGGLLCVVEEYKDLQAIEAAGGYRGRYHVLLGALAPLDGVAPKDLTVEALLERIRQAQGGEPVREVILATNPNFEGDGTALFLREKLRAYPGIKITRIARGIQSGSHLEHVSRTIVADAIEGRREMAD